MQKVPSHTYYQKQALYSYNALRELASLPTVTSLSSLDQKWLDTVRTSLKGIPEKLGDYVQYAAEYLAYVLNYTVSPLVFHGIIVPTSEAIQLKPETWIESQILVNRALNGLLELILPEQTEYRSESDEQLRAKLRAILVSEEGRFWAAKLTLAEVIVLSVLLSGTLISSIRAEPLGQPALGPGPITAHELAEIKRVLSSV